MPYENLGLRKIGCFCQNSFAGETNQRNISETNDPLREILSRVNLGKNKFCKFFEFFQTALAFLFITFVDIYGKSIHQAN